MARILSGIIVLPLLGALLTIFIGKRAHRPIVFATSLITLLLSILMVIGIDPAVIEPQFVEIAPWIDFFNISYSVGVNGVSAALIVLSSTIFFLGSVWTSDLEKGSTGYYALYLLLETCVLGTLASNDLFLFFSFWVLSLVPAYFLLGIWGGEDRENAATKFFVMQLMGCALVLIAMLTIYHSVDPHTFSLQELSKTSFAEKRIELAGHSWRLDKFIFVLLFIGLGIRLPLFPFHSWLTHSIRSAPTALAVIFASVFVKTGAFAILKINYALFPDAAAWFAPATCALGVISIIYGGVCALGQTDLRRMLAFITTSQMGFVLLGIGVLTAASVVGSILHLLIHGIYSALLMFLIGALGERVGRFDLFDVDESAKLSGIVHRAPLLAGFFVVAVFSCIGLPGFGAFSSGTLVLLGSYSAHGALTVLALFGMVITGGYLLLTFRQVFLGPESSLASRVTDLNLREKAFLIPLVVLAILVGSYPKPILSLIEPVLSAGLKHGQPEAQAPEAPPTPAPEAK